MKIHKMIGSAFFSGLLVFGFLISSAAPANAEKENPWKVVWYPCPSGSAVTHVIRCEQIGGEACYANWQYFCDENPYGD